MKTVLLTFLLLPMSALEIFQKEPCSNNLTSFQTNVSDSSVVKPYPKPEFIDKPYILLDSSRALIALEENNINVKPKMSKMIYTIGDSVAAKNAVSDSIPYLFIMDLRNKEIVQKLVIYKLEEYKGKRALVIRAGTSPDKLEESIIKVNFKDMGDGLYNLIPQRKLEPGEYAFILNWSSYSFRVE